jgi:mRNA interferase MazF
MVNQKHKGGLSRQAWPQFNAVSTAMKAMKIGIKMWSAVTRKNAACKHTASQKTPRLKSAPKVQQLYWCDFPEDAQLPEMWKRRPVIVISYKKIRLHGAVTVVPCSTQTQPDNGAAFPLRTTIDGRAGWAICDKPTTVAVSRLLPDKTGIRRMPVEEFNDMLIMVLDWLPKLR